MLPIFTQNVFFKLFSINSYYVALARGTQILSPCLIFNHSIENKNLVLKLLTLGTRKETKQ